MRKEIQVQWIMKMTLISSSCSLKYSSLRWRSASESSGAAALTESTTSEGREDKVACIASSGRTLPDTMKALHKECNRQALQRVTNKCKGARTLTGSITVRKIIDRLHAKHGLVIETHRDRIRSEEGNDLFNERSSQSFSCIKRK